MNGKSSSGVVLVGKVVVVAVKVSKEISRRALFWALTHVVQPGDCIKLLVVLPAHSSNKRVWGFTKFTSDCTSGNRKSLSGTKLDQRDDISDSCSEMLRHLHDVYDPEKIKIRVKVVSGSSSGVVAAEAKKAQSNWVILDKHLKHETKYCMEELQCNVVVMKRSQPKVLRLNLIGSPMMQPEVSWPLPIDVEASSNDLDSTHSQLDILRGPYVTPASSPDHESSVTITDAGTSSISSSDPGNSPFFLSGIYGSQKKEHLLFTEDNQSLYESESDADSDKQYPPSTRSYYQPWMDDNMSSSGELTKGLLDGFQRSKNAALAFTYKSLLENLSKLDLEPDVGVMNYRIDLNVSKSVREAISLSTHVLPGPPPLCSVCRHKAPVFGNPPKWFTYAELELATDGFSGDNFLAEGGFGSVHRGVLTNGQVVAVKQHKLASSQGDMEFCSEVEVLSCAQHRNVVTLIGFCVEDGRRLLVYEYICNGSLDSHLFGHDKDPLKWSARQKIAVGAARGLRYLHEECRVGCIVHRDMRPNNILITHDFEPLVGDFGLARWQPNGDMGVETRIIGTFGYLAPEYAQSGQITEKADVYSFGVVLVELVTGRKAIDIKRPKGQQCLTEWARPLLEKQANHELVDPRLRNCYPEEEVHNMLQCASLCILRDSHARPRISQVRELVSEIPQNKFNISM
ncbi:ATP binding protein, putative [Ricinus communis]|uniref:ATP binding protein, putative n=2 Tax=Ricinus communis TaxID=3988 RepID=B9RKA4_RICCO|nr:ATP binding protein, putative [Ricinus communis]